MKVLNRLSPKNLKRMRLVVGYKQSELAKALEISTNYISMYETNNRISVIPAEAKEKLKSWISSNNLDLKTLPKLKGSL